MTEEAKRCAEALRMCPIPGYRCCDCPVYVPGKPCQNEIEAADMIESMSAQLEQVEKERDRLNIMLAQAQAMLETRTKERDAAVEDLRLIACGNFNCETCGHYAYDEDDESRICADCDVETYSNWQWRGVREVE